MCMLPFSLKHPDVCEQSHPPHLGVSFFRRARARKFPQLPDVPTYLKAVSKVTAVSHITYMKTIVAAAVAAAAVTTTATTADRAWNCTERCDAATVASSLLSASAAAGQG